VDESVIERGELEQLLALSKVSGPRLVKKLFAMRLRETHNAGHAKDELTLADLGS
jgi:hypothetical protein